MPFIPHTAAETEQMLRSIGVGSIDALFDEIPAALHCGELSGIPAALSEQQVTRLMESRAERDGHYLSFLGAGAYEHFIPAAIWQIVTRGEFYTAYTPYQAEASQGTLQLLYEFQSMMSSLTGLDVSNASLYDGASALAEAVLMAVRAHAARGHRVVVPRTVHPLYRQVLRSVVAQQGIELVELPYIPGSGRCDVNALARIAQGAAAVVIPQPNFFGVLEEVDALTDIAHDAGALAIALCNPIALGLLSPPGDWGKTGADICCGEAQPLGLPLSGGGPYLGYLASRSALVRQMPGRIVGRTVDLNGRPGFTLTLQAREQHIRRAKATSNICTNQGLMVVAATLYMALLGAHGLSGVARACHDNTRRLRERLVGLPGVEPAFDAPFFHECVLRMPCDTGALLAGLREEGVLAGLELSGDYPELERTLLVCATETKTDEDLDRLVEALAGRLK